MDIEHVQYMFDGFCRRVLKNAANDYYDSIQRRAKHEVPLSNCYTYPYHIDYSVVDQVTYIVMGEEIRFTEPSIIEALNTFSEEGRTVILAYCVLGLPDRVIANYLHVERRTLTYRRAKLFQELRRLLLRV